MNPLPFLQVSSTETVHVNWLIKMNDNILTLSFGQLFGFVGDIDVISYIGTTDYLLSVFIPTGSTVQM
jgi:hypothetical protein